MPPLRSLLITLLSCAALAPAAHAQFTGNFALTPPDGQTFMNNTSAGNWNYSISGSGSDVFDTSGAPDSFVLFAEAVDISGSSASTLTIVSPEAGTLSFDYDLQISAGGSFTPATGSFTYTLASNTTTLSTGGTGTVYWNVEAGDTITFNTTANGGQDSIFIPPPGPGIIPVPASGSATVTISNFTFTAVPEPSTFAAVFGVCSLGLVWLRRKKAKMVG